MRFFSTWRGRVVAVLTMVGVTFGVASVVMPQGGAEQGKSNPPPVVVPRGGGDSVAALSEVMAAAAPTIDAYLAWQRAEDVNAVLAWVAAKEAEAAARVSALRQVSVTRSVPTTGTVGDCTGFVIPSYIIARESGGNPSASNPSGAYGCAQTLLSHYSSGGTCAGLNPYDIQGQRDCVYRLSDGGTNLSPWAATR